MEIASTDSTASSADTRTALAPGPLAGTWAGAAVRQKPTAEQARTEASTERRVTRETLTRRRRCDGTDARNGVTGDGPSA